MIEPGDRARHLEPEHAARGQPARQAKQQLHVIRDELQHRIGEHHVGR
jgi:hypothetical protein